VKTPYSFVIIRYVHDKVTGEFVNMGVVLYAPSAGFLEAQCASSAYRLRRMFGRVDSEHIRDLLRHMERRIHQIGREVGSPSLFHDKTHTVATFAQQILPPDDSSLQLSHVAGGVTEDPQRELAAIFERYVNRYSHGRPKTTRQDEEVLPVFRKPLEEKRLLVHVQPKLIVAPDYEHEFPLAWKNGVWNACDAVSFDLTESSDVIEKANKWLGRATNLSESSEDFRLVLLVGEPRRLELKEASFTAEKILRKAPGDLILIKEREAQKLAEMIEQDLAHQDR
jgi:hypothetical protein